jgi:hypothetical protein
MAMETGVTTEKTFFCDTKSETLEIDLTGTVSQDRFGF